MPLSPGGTATNPDGAADNEGPHCRNCHIGGNSCQQCHGSGALFGTTVGWWGTTANKVDGNANRNPYQPQAFVHTSAVAGLNGQCIDGGFSWPHRTLGKDLLKDELYGVDWDGTKIGPGLPRGSNATSNGPNAAVFAQVNNLPTGFAGGQSAYASWLTEYNYAGTDIFINRTGTTLGFTSTTQNLDSVCLDCHGDASFWNGDDPTFIKTYTNQYGVQQGWELMFKGLP